MSDRALPYAVAVFGAGRWGVHLLRNFLQNPRSRLVAVVDPSIDRLHALRSIDLQDAKLFTDWQAAMQLPGLVAVTIATPASTHYSLIRSALKQGLHVLAEKPLTLDTQQALELCALAQRQQRQLVVDHTYLFHPAVRSGKTQIPRLGNLRYGYATRSHPSPVRQDTNVLWDLAIHDLTIFNHWLNETPQQVEAQGTTWLQPGIPDLVWAKLTYPSGFQATLHLCWCNPDKQRRLGIVGSQGTLVFDEISATPLILQQSGTNGQPHPEAILVEAIDVEAVEPLQQVCDHFLDCIQQNRPSALSPGWLGAELVQTLDALSRSLYQNGKPMAIEPR